MNRSCRMPRGITYLDLMMVVCLLLVTAAAAAPMAAQLRERNLRIQCAANLRELGRAMMFYANHNKGAYPRTRYDSAAGALNFYTGASAPDPFAKEGAPKPNDVTAAMYLLLRETEPARVAELTGRKAETVIGRSFEVDLEPRQFRCPSVVFAQLDAPAQARVDQALEEAFRPDAPEAPRRRRTITPDWIENPQWAKARRDRSNFSGPGELHYSMAHMYPPRPSIEKGYKFHSGVVADLAIVADVNPGNPELLKATLSRGALGDIHAKVNSPNHGGQGQNVMFNDGHVEWFITPLAGAERDNIYTYGRTTRGSGGEGIVGPPGWDLDSVLLPTAGQEPTEKRNGAAQ